MKERLYKTSRYQIESLTKGLMVLEALEGDVFEPVTIKKIVDRTGLSRDFCFRALHTFQTHGYAIRVNRKWSIGKRFIQSRNALVTLRK